MSITIRWSAIPAALSMSLLVFGCSEESNANTNANSPDVSVARDASVRDADERTDEQSRDAGKKEEEPERDAGADASPEGGKALNPTCDHRTGGAWITFNIGTEVLTVWSTNTMFNSEAFSAALKGNKVTPVFKDLVEGVDCDGQWTWHTDPENLSFEASSPTCEGLPSWIEGNKVHWLNDVDRYCPKDVLISAFQSASM